MLLKHHGVDLNMQDNPCRSCIARPVCFAQEIDLLNGRHLSHRIYSRKDFLLRAGDEYQGLYALRSGVAKSVMTIEGGHEQILHFHYPGELLGTDGFNNQHHVNDIQFLDTSNVCFFSACQLEKLLSESEDSLHRLLSMMSKEIVEDHQNLLSVSQLSGAQRLARFLLNLSERLACRGLSGNSFDLVMSRTDLANYLGMTIETISRLLNRFQRDNVIKVKQRRVDILNQDKLHNYLSHDHII